MRLIEYGDPCNKVIMLIHGTQVPWQIWMPQIEHFSKLYHVIIPVLPGHDPVEKSTFETIEKTVLEIEAQCISRFGNQIHAICGQSLGGTIASVIFQRGKVIIDLLLLESAPLIAQPKLLASILTKQYISLTHKVKQRKPQTLQMAEKSFLPHRCISAFIEIMDAMTEDSIKNFVASTARFQLSPDIDIGATRVVYILGTALNELLSKKSAEFLSRHYPQIEIMPLRGYTHCELSLYRPEEYNRIVQLLLEKETTTSRG